MFLEIEFIFPAGRFHGEDWEWPPAPARVFQALIAGTYRGAHGLINQDRRDAALRWLEALPPPAVAAPPAAFSCSHLDNYVPNNDGESVQHVRTAKTLAVHAFPAGGALAYHWAFDAAAPDAPAHADTIAAMASLITYLGQTTDSVFARGGVHAELPSVDSADGRTLYLPRVTPGGAWLAPAPGFLALCQRRYPRSVSSEPPDFTNSRQVDYAPAGAAAAPADTVPLAIFDLLHLDGEPRRWWPEQMREPAGLVRHALTEWGKRPCVVRAFGADPVARLIAGHRAAGDAAPCDHNGHFGVVPLPSLNAAGTADGDFRRAALVGWGITTREERELFEEAARGLHGAEPADQSAPQQPRVRLRRTDASLTRHWTRFWTEPARCWRSVTPVVLPGHPRPSRPAESYLARALAQAGYGPAEVESVAAFPGPLVPHTRPARDYRIRDGDYLAQTPRCHVEVRFRRPVAGPLVLGRGRYVGLGLCLPFHPNRA